MNFSVFVMQFCESVYVQSHPFLVMKDIVAWCLDSCCVVVVWSDARWRRVAGSDSRIAVHESLPESCHGCFIQSGLHPEDTCNCLLPPYHRVLRVCRICISDYCV